MSMTFRCDVDFHIACRGHGARRAIDPGLKQACPALGRIPRIARLMALALRFDEYLRTGQVANHAGQTSKRRFFCCRGRCKDVIRSICGNCNRSQRF